MSMVDTGGLTHEYRFTYTITREGGIKSSGGSSGAYDSARLNIYAHCHHQLNASLGVHNPNNVVRVQQILIVKKLK